MPALPVARAVRTADRHARPFRSGAAAEAAPGPCQGLPAARAVGRRAHPVAARPEKRRRLCTAGLGATHCSAPPTIFDRRSRPGEAVRTRRACGLGHERQVRQRQLLCCSPDTESPVISPAAARTYTAPVNAISCCSCGTLMDLMRRRRPGDAAGQGSWTPPGAGSG